MAECIERVFCARTMCCDRRIGPHHRNRRPHPALRRLLRGRRRREGGPGRAQRHREVVLHLGPGGGDRRPSCATGATSASSARSGTCPRRRCRVASGSSRPGSRTSSRPGASTSSTTRWAPPARRMADDPSEENIELFTDLQEQFQSNGGYEAESVMARLADGLGLRQELLLEDIDVALGRPAPPGRPDACALPGARADDPRRADEPPRPLGQALAARRAGALRRRAPRGEPRPQAARPVDHQGAAHREPAADRVEGQLLEVRGAARGRPVAARARVRARAARDHAPLARWPTPCGRAPRSGPARPSRWTGGSSGWRRSAPRSTSASEASKFTLPTPPRSGATPLEVAKLGVRYGSNEVLVGRDASTPAGATTS